MTTRPSSLIATLTLLGSSVATIRAEAATYTYDGANRLISITEEAIVTTYSYDGLDNVVRSCTALSGVNQGCKEVVTEGSVLAEIGADTKLRAHGPKGIAAIRSVAGTQYPVYDQIGSTVALVSGAGTLTDRVSRGAFGQQRAGGSAADLEFGGHYTQNARVWMRARWYAPDTGRLLERDSFGGASSAPETLNRYAYVSGNPLNSTDPSGHVATSGWAPELERAPISAANSMMGASDMVIDGMIGLPALPARIAMGLDWFPNYMSNFRKSIGTATSADDDCGDPQSQFEYGFGRNLMGLYQMKGWFNFRNWMKPWNDRMAGTALSKLGWLRHGSVPMAGEYGVDIFKSQHMGEWFHRFKVVRSPEGTYAWSATNVESVKRGARGLVPIRIQVEGPLGTGRVDDLGELTQLGYDGGFFRSSSQAMNQFEASQALTNMREAAYAMSGTPYTMPLGLSYLGALTGDNKAWQAASEAVGLPPPFNSRGVSTTFGPEQICGNNCWTFAK